MAAKGQALLLGLEMHWTFAFPFFCFGHVRLSFMSAGVRVGPRCPFAMPLANLQKLDAYCLGRPPVIVRLIVESTPFPSVCAS